ncbi:hypothetical protein HDE_10539 [Halotydeus destructor]|nr:hypothetical protein HDE_10539 [Halotydeus destructor]
MDNGNIEVPLMSFCNYHTDGHKDGIPMTVTFQDCLNDSMDENELDVTSYTSIFTSDLDKDSSGNDENSENQGTCFNSSVITDFINDAEQQNLGYIEHTISADQIMMQIFPGSNALPKNPSHATYSLKSHLRRHSKRSESLSDDSANMHDDAGEMADDDTQAAAALLTSLSSVQTDNTQSASFDGRGPDVANNVTAYAVIPLTKMADCYAALEFPKVITVTPEAETTFELEPVEAMLPSIDEMKPCCTAENIIFASAAQADICKCEPGLCQKDGKPCCSDCPGNEMGLCKPIPDQENFPISYPQSTCCSVNASH